MFLPSLTLLTLISMGILSEDAAAAATSPSLAFTTTAPSSSSSKYILRPYDPVKDLDALHDICQNVYGGSDYLPKTAATLASDTNSNFVVLADTQTDRPAAVGNARTFKLNMSWLEAIRTCERHRSKGLARQLTQSLVEMARADGHEMYSCTVESNVSMQKVFAKIDMKRLAKIHQCSFEKLKKLPGWAAVGDDQTVTPQPLLQSLGVDIGNIEDGSDGRVVKTLIETHDELNEALKYVADKGGIGHLVGLYELLPDAAVHKSLEGGRLWKVQLSKDDNEADDMAIMAMVREEKISSLRSPWVCSITATSAAALETALRYACSVDHCLKKLDGHVGFTVAFDLCGFPLPTDDKELYPAVSALPLTDDACLLFGSSKV